MDIRRKRASWSKYLGLFGLSVLIIFVAVVINLFGIYATGSVEDWQAWRAESYEYFLAWRLVVYAFIARGWMSMRKRLLQQDPTAGPRAKRVGFALISLVVLFEVLRAQAYGLWGTA